MEIYQLQNKSDLRDFIEFPYLLYKENPYWVPPLKIDAKKFAMGKTPLFQRGPHIHYIIKENKKTLGRITVGIDELYNKAKGTQEAYFTLFESINDQKVANMLLQKAEEFAKEKGMKQIKGPISPTNGDDFRGLLVENFNVSPSLLESYNLPYYKKLLENKDYKPFYDFYSYLFDLQEIDLDRYENGTRYAMEKYGFFIKAPHPKDIKKNKKEILKHLKYIMDKAIPNDWLDPIIPPSMAELNEIFKELIPLAVKGSLIIAYSNEKEPIGFNISLPNYNEVLKKLNGRILPFGWLKFLYYKSKIKGAKSFIMFVIPLWQKKGVSSSIYLKGLKCAKKYGYKWVEGGTIGKDNTSMRRDAEKLGGKIYKTFRLYIKDLQF